MATKSSTKKTKQKHDLVYIMSNSCGWCKKSDPLVSELKGDGYDITTLDVMNPDEGARANELKQKYNIQCGTPLFLDAETGNQVCGFREKDVLEQWAKGEEIPKPPQPNGMPPRPPVDIGNANEADLKEFKKGYEEWASKNDHLPNVLTFDQAVERIKAGQEAQKNQANNPGAPNQPNQPNQPNNPTNTKTRGSSSGIVGPGGRERGTNKNITYYYIIEDGDRVAVFANADYIMNITAQYYVLEDQGPQSGGMTKVIGDNEWSNAFRKAPVPPIKSVNPPKPQLPKKKEVDAKVKSQIQKVKEQSAAKNKDAEKRSKKNTKTIESF